MARCWYRAAVLLGEKGEESTGPQVARPFRPPPIVTPAQLRISCLLSVDLVRCAIGQICNGAERDRDAINTVLDVIAKKGLRVGAVALLDLVGDGFVVARDRLVSIVRHADA